MLLRKLTPRKSRARAGERMNTLSLFSFSFSLLFLSLSSPSPVFEITAALVFWHVSRVAARSQSAPPRRHRLSRPHLVGELQSVLAFPSRCLIEVLLCDSAREKPSSTENKPTNEKEENEPQKERDQVHNRRRWLRDEGDRVTTCEAKGATDERPETDQIGTSHFRSTDPGARERRMSSVLRIRHVRVLGWLGKRELCCACLFFCS